MGHGGVQTTTEMVQLLDDRDLSVRKAAARAIGKLGKPESVGVLMDALAADRVPLTIVGMAILHIGPAAVDPLREILAAPHPVQRRLAAECLGILGAVGAVEDLIDSAANEPVPEVSQAAIRALGRIGSPAASTILTHLMATDSVLATRVEAATALGRIGGEEVVDELHKAAMGPNSDVVQAATHALRWTGSSGVDRLRLLSAQACFRGAHAREALSAAVGYRREGAVPS